MKHRNLVSGFFSVAILCYIPHSMAEIVTKKEKPADDWSTATQPRNLDAQPPKVIHMNQDRQFRCWQKGQLIVQADDWQPIDGSKGGLMQKGPKKLHAYDYGETFCLYLGGN